MGNRGRTSQEALSVVSVTELDRPRPPDGMPDDQAEVWRRIVRSLPAGWFGPETQMLLTQYCRHTVRADQLARIINREEDRGIPDPKVYAVLLGREHNQSNILAVLAGKMRLSQQATVDKRSSKKSASAARLWDSGEAG